MTDVANHYPEVRAGGFTRVDGTVQFYLRIHALLEEAGPGPVVLDFGAGGGTDPDDLVPIRRELRDLRRKAAAVIGVDVDRSVLSNPWLTEAHVIGPEGRLPVEDGSIDLVVADHVFEHLEHPDSAAAELHRVLREGGWICARTPNKWGYIAVGARLVPNTMHVGALGRLQPDRRREDIFPTVYRLNTRRALARHFPRSHFEHVIYGWTGEPAYAGKSALAFAAFRALGWFTPDPLRPALLVFLRLRSPAPRFAQAPTTSS